MKILKSNNILSLFPEDRDMAKKNNPQFSEPFSIGDFHIGEMGGKYFVWNNKFNKDLKAANFAQAKKEAYKEIVSYCDRIQQPPPPPPKG